MGSVLPSRIDRSQLEAIGSLDAFWVDFKYFGHFFYFLVLAKVVVNNANAWQSCQIIFCTTQKY